jgi:hypothetical protein
MPARGGPALIALERAGRPDLRLVLVQSGALERLRAASRLEDLERWPDALLIPAGWLAPAAASS